MAGIISAGLRAPSQGLVHGSSSISICGEISGCVNDVNLEHIWASSLRSERKNQVSRWGKKIIPSSVPN